MTQPPPSHSKGLAPVDPSLRAAETRRLVRRGWDRASKLYRPDRPRTDVFGHTQEEYRRWIRPVLDGVPNGERVLDLGCGSGVPTSALLAEKFRVVGVDLSTVQLDRARQ